LLLCKRTNTSYEKDALSVAENLEPKASIHNRDMENATDTEKTELARQTMPAGS